MRNAIGYGLTLAAFERGSAMTAEEWVQRAIACGAKPVAERHTGSIIEMARGFDHEAHPGELPDNLFLEVFHILVGIGARRRRRRTRCTERRAARQTDGG